MKLRSVVLLFATCVGCATSHPSSDPVGRMFPDVRGTTLDGTEVSLPDDLRGAPALLLIGYEQRSQFDIDRWLLGLRQSRVDVRVYELPTLPGLLPRLFARSIDSGMRSGIPEEDWRAVITVYADGDELARFLGNENGLPARVVLLDASGHVRFFHDRGFSIGTLERLQDALRTR